MKPKFQTFIHARIHYFFHRFLSFLGSESKSGRFHPVASSPAARDLPKRQIGTKSSFCKVNDEAINGLGLSYLGLGSPLNAFADCVPPQIPSAEKEKEREEEPRFY